MRVTVHVILVFTGRFCRLYNDGGCDAMRCDVAVRPPTSSDSKAKRERAIESFVDRSKSVEGRSLWTWKSRARARRR